MVPNLFFQQDTNRRITLPRDLRNLRQLELVSKILNWEKYKMTDSSIFLETRYLSIVPMMDIGKTCECIWQ